MYVCVVVSSRRGEAWESLWELLRVSQKQNSSPDPLLHLRMSQIKHNKHVIVFACTPGMFWYVELSAHYYAAHLTYPSSSICKVHILQSFISTNTNSLFVWSTGVCLICVLVIASLLWIGPSYLLWDPSSTYFSQLQTKLCLNHITIFPVFWGSLFIRLICRLFFLLPTWHFQMSKAICAKKLGNVVDGMFF